MLGHEIRLSQTNTYGWVPLCACGWIGNVVPHVRARKTESARTLRVQELTQSIARARHGEHLHDVRADIEARSMRVLAAIPGQVAAANQTLQRRGRWGHS